MLAGIIPLSTTAETSAEKAEDANLSTSSQPTIICEDTSKREENVKQFYMSDGSYTAIMYSEPVHYQDTDGQFQNIDNTLELKTVSKSQKYYSNKANALHVQLPAISTDLVKATVKDHTLSWSLQNQQAATASVSSPDVSAAASTDKNLSAEEKAAKDIQEKITPKNHTSQITYAQIMEDVHLQYDVQGSRLKESLILSEGPTETSFTFYLFADGMTATLQPDNTVTFRDDKTQDVIFTLAAPYMIDKEQQTSTLIDVSLQKQGNTYIYTIEPDKEWLAEAAYPVIIDPTLETSQRTVQTSQVYNKEPNTVFKGSSLYKLYIGNDIQSDPNEQSVYRAYVKIPTPTFISTVDRINSATLAMEYSPDGIANLSNAEISVHKVTSSWDTSSITWNRQPSYDSTTLDYANANQTMWEKNWWNITSLVEDWLQGGENNGIMLSRDIIHGDRSNYYASYYTEFRNDVDAAPHIIINYRPVIGVDDTWTSTTMGDEEAASVRVNHNAGNILAVVPIGNTESESLPIDLKLIYSYPDCDGEVYGKCSMGSHWRSSCNLEVHPYSAGNYAYYLIDDQARRIYFRKSGNTFVDEMGLNYTLTVNSSSTDARYTISDDDTTMTFNSRGQIVKLQDSENHQNTFTYGDPSPYQQSVYPLTSITDGNGKVIQMTYASDGRLTAINMPNGKQYQIEYVSSLIGSITDPNGKATQFSYFNAGHKEPLQYVTYSDGSKVTISYINATQTNDFYVNRRFPVESIQYSKGNTVREKYTFAYRHNETDVTDMYNNKVTYLFNNEGLTTGLVDRENGLGQYYTYDSSTSTGTANQMVKSSKLMYSVNNKVKNGSCSSIDEWTTAAAMGSTLSIDTTVGYTAAGALKIEKTAAGSSSSHFVQSITALEPGMYTASCYVTTNGSALTSGTTDLKLRALNSSNAEQRTAKAVGIKATGSGEWRRLVASIEIKAGETLQINAGASADAVGTLWMDDFQVETGEVPNLYNLLQNTDFDYNDYGWTTPSSMGPEQATVFGIMEHEMVVSQIVPLHAAEGEKISFGGWGKANSASLGSYNRSNAPTFGITLTFYSSTHADCGSPVHLSFNNEITDWQFLCGEATVPADAAYAKFVYEYNYNINTASFKNGFIYRDVFNETDESQQSDTTEETAYDYSAQRQWTTEQQDSHGNTISSETFTATPATAIVDEQTYYIINAATGDALCAPSIDESDAIYTHALILGDSTYQWRIHLYEAAFNWYNIYSAGTYTGISMADADATAEGLPFLHRSIEGMLPQMMRFEYNNDGTFFITPVISGHYMDCTTADEQPTDTRYSYVRQYAKNTENPDGQKWIFIPVSSVGSKTIKTSSTYSDDGEDQLTATDERGKTTQYTYDHGNENYHTTYITEPGRDTIEYIYNSDNNLKEVRSGPTYETNTYNTDGQLTATQYDHGDTRYAFAYDDLGRPTSIDIGDGTHTNRLVTYAYGTNQQLSSQIYGNGSGTTLEYNSYGQVTKKTVGSHVFQYVYDQRSQLALEKDLANNIRTRYTYDGNGNILQTITTTGATIDSGVEQTNVQLSYDSTGHESSTSIAIDGVQKGLYSYRYGTGVHTERVQGVNFNGSEKLTYTYDDFGRISSKQIHTGQANKTISYTYLNGASSKNTTHTIERESFGSNDALVYTYDDSGNITKIADASGNTLRAYTYSRLTGQLLSEENAATGTKTTYQYGNYNGNLLSKTTTPLAGGTATTISYAYGNTTGWKDQLTAYNGDVITYDASGNPLTYRNGMTMTWQGGRELTTATNNGTSIAYSYNTNSIRTKKTVGGVATQYYLNGDTMVAEKKGSNLITYMFDETGERYGFLYNNTPYFYVRNMQGDVIRILNLFGSVLAQYEYDAWGKVLSVTDSDGDAITGATHIGNINPIRYRGYYYDTETGFYYLQSRYYDPEIGRFINADEPEMAKFSTKELLAKDLFAYCNNNPIHYSDPDGHLALTAIYKYIQHKFRLAIPAARYIGWIVRHANWIYNSTLKFSGYIYGQANGSAAKARMGLLSGKNNGCGWIATYNALKILGKTIHPKNIIYFYECWGSILQGAFGVLPDAVADFFRLQGRKVSTLNLTRKGIDKKIKSSKVSILCYAHSKGLHYIAIKWTGKKFQVYNITGFETTFSEKDSIEKFLQKDRAPISLIAIS